MTAYVFCTFGTEPMLYAAKDCIGTRYLCFCCQQSKQWVVGQVSESTLISLAHTKFTAREVFEAHCIRKFHVLRDGQEYLYQCEFSDDLLPDANIPLDLTQDSLNSYLEIWEDLYGERIRAQIRSQRKDETDLVSDMATATDNAVKRTRLAMAQKFVSLKLPLDLIARATELSYEEVEGLQIDE